MVSVGGSYVRAIRLMTSAHRSHAPSMTWRSVESGLAERRSWPNSLIWLIFSREKSFHAWLFQLKSRACRLQYSTSILYLSVAAFFGLSNRLSHAWNTGQKAYQRRRWTRDGRISCSYGLYFQVLRSKMLALGWSETVGGRESSVCKFIHM